MALNIRWSSRASLQFDEILDYLTDEFGHSSASKFAKRIYKFTDTLAVFPDIGKIQNKEIDIRGFVVEKRSTVLYKIYKDHVLIISLYNNRQDPVR